MTCEFSASDPTVQLAGAIFRTGDVTSSGNVIKFVSVVGRVSTLFDLPTGDYRYEFNIMSGRAFTLTLQADNAHVTTGPGDFDPDPDDPLKKASAKIDRKMLFTLS